MKTRDSTDPDKTTNNDVPEELIPTRHTLLSRLKDWRDDDSWRDFFNIYWRLIYGFALKAGLTDQEAQEVVQETAITVARRIPEFRYDPSVCSFKTWLLNLTRWRIVDQLRKRGHVASHRARSTATGTATVERIPDPASLNLEAVWDREWQQHLLEAAIRSVKAKVKPEHYQVFHLCVFKEWPVKKVSRELEMSAPQVYLAKHRIAALLKREIRSMERRLSQSTGQPAQDP